jgi:TrmH RNA methyltransferase
MVAAMPRPTESLVYGLQAALALGRHRPDAIHRVLHTEARRKDVGPLLKAAASRHRPYREVPAEELERVAKSVHHEGVVVVADPLPLVPLPDLLQRVRAAGRGGLLVALDGVGNPHNLGAILRSAAYFGAQGVIFPVEPRQATLSAAAVRVAQGGAEVVACVGVPDLTGALADVSAAGLRVVGAEPEARRSALDQPLPRPLCLVFGNEATGLGPSVRAVCRDRVRIPGTGAVQSLNVAVAAGILLAAASVSP